MAQRIILVCDQCAVELSHDPEKPHSFARVAFSTYAADVCSIDCAVQWLRKTMKAAKVVQRGIAAKKK